MKIHRYLDHNIFATLVRGAFKDGFLSENNPEVWISEQEDSKYANIVAKSLPFLNEIKPGKRHPLTGKPTPEAVRTSLSDVLRSARQSGRCQKNIVQRPPQAHDHVAVENWVKDLENIETINEKVLSQKAYSYSINISDQNDSLRQAGRFGKTFELSQTGKMTDNTKFAETSIYEKINPGDIIEYARHYFCRVEQISGNTIFVTVLTPPLRNLENVQSERTGFKERNVKDMHITGEEIEDLLICSIPSLRDKLPKLVKHTRKSSKASRTKKKTIRKKIKKNTRRINKK